MYINFRTKRHRIAYVSGAFVTMYNNINNCNTDYDNTYYYIFIPVTVVGPDDEMICRKAVVKIESAKRALAY